MSSIDSRANIANLGLQRLDGPVALEDLQGKAPELQPDTLLAELEHPSVQQPVIDDGETVLTLTAWPRDGALKMLKPDHGLPMVLAGLDLPTAIDQGIDSVVDGLV